MGSVADGSFRAVGAVQKGSCLFLEMQQQQQPTRISPILRQIVFRGSTVDSMLTVDALNYVVAFEVSWWNCFAKWVYEQVVAAAAVDGAAETFVVGKLGPWSLLLFYWWRKKIPVVRFLVVLWSCRCRPLLSLS